MKQIDDFIHSVYVHVQNREEAEELKAEMRSHLLESVQDLKKSGLSEQEAVKLAIERFGNEHVLRSKIVKHFQASQLFAVNLLRTAILLAVIAVLAWGYFAYDHYRTEYESERVVKEVQSLLANVLEADQQHFDQITAIAESFPRLKTLKLAPFTGTEKGSVIFTYNHPKPFKKIQYVNATEGRGDVRGNWYVDITVESFEVILTTAVVAALLAYWLLFAIWGILQAWRHRRLNVIWTIAFLLFNAPAYLVYRTSVRWISPEPV